MAGNGSGIKHPSVRARRNRSTTRAELGDDDPDAEVPPLPPHLETDLKTGKVIETPWHPMTVEWWEDIWPSPMAAEWHSSDVHGLYRLARLVDKFWYASGLKEMREASAEIRLVSQQYGLAPLDRRKLEWTIAGSKKATRENAKAEAKPDQPAPPTSAAGGPPDLRLVVE
jgi:hypothetical protein